MPLNWWSCLTFDIPQISKFTAMICADRTFCLLVAESDMNIIVAVSCHGRSRRSKAFLCSRFPNLICEHFIGCLGYWIGSLQAPRPVDITNAETIQARIQAQM